MSPETPPSSDPRVRPAGAADVAPLAALYAEFFAEDAIAVDPAKIAANLSRMIADERACIWVLEQDGALLGFSSASLTFGVEFGCAAEIEDLYVTPGARGKGHARTLFQEALTWSDAAGAAEILLVITPEAEAAQALTGLYRRFGFADSRRILMYRGGAAV